MPGLHSLGQITAVPLCLGLLVRKEFNAVLTMWQQVSLSLCWVCSPDLTLQTEEILLATFRDTQKVEMSPFCGFLEFSQRRRATRSQYCSNEIFACG